MVESNAHKLLKQQAVCILKEKGFSEKEMFEEYRFNDMIVDYVGIKAGLRVAIECGDLNGTFGDEKIDRLKKDFDVVIHMPYLKKGKCNKGYFLNRVLIAVPVDVWNQLKSLKLWVGEPHYHVIGRLIVEHKERV